MALMPFIAALAIGLGAVSVTGDASVFGVVGIVAAIIGTGLVGYFNWREVSTSDPESEPTMNGAPHRRDTSWSAEQVRNEGRAGSSQRCDHPGRWAASPKKSHFQWLFALAGLMGLALRTGHVAGGIPLKVRRSCP